MLNVELLEEHAYNVLKIALKCNYLRGYILGFPPFSISTQDESGNDVECIFAKMEAIYKYSIDNPTSGIGEQLYDLLKELTVKLRSPMTIINVLRMIEHQIVAERENRAAFKMNNEELLENLKENLAINEDMYLSPVYAKKGFMTTIRQHDEMLFRYYGRRILENGHGGEDKYLFVPEYDFDV